MFWWFLTLTTVLRIALGLSVDSDVLADPLETLDCHRRIYNLPVSQADSQGRVCWDTVPVMSCWGRCDSNEISDWRFPYKRSHHPVCLHEGRTSGLVELRNCDPDVESGTEIYNFVEALSCKCSVCKTSKASCEGLRYRGQRSGVFTFPR